MMRDDHPRHYANIEKTKFSNKSDWELYDMWAKFKRVRAKVPEDFGPEDQSWLTMLEREILIDELFNRFFLKNYC
jgi:hypothetical protein